LKAAQIVFLALLSFSSRAFAQTAVAEARHPWIPYPDFYPVHTGSYQGFLATGVGYKFGGIEAQGLLGYVPAAIGGRDLLQATAKSLIDILTVERNQWQSRLVVGLGLLYGQSDKLFVLLPDKYPAGYYPPSAIRFLLLTGVKQRFSKEHEVAFEFAWFDSELERLYEDGQLDGIFRRGTYGIGYRYWMASSAH
jgi:hypothetical protein